MPPFFFAEEKMMSEERCEALIGRISGRIDQLKNIYISALGAASRMSVNEYALFCNCVGETPSEYIANVAQAVVEFERVMLQDKHAYVALGAEAIESDLVDFNDLLCVLTDIVGGVGNSPPLRAHCEDSGDTKIH